MTAQEFEALWRDGQSGPDHIEVPVTKEDLHISMTEIVDTFQDLATKALKRRMIKKADYDELVAQSTSYKQALSRVDEDAILRLAD